MENNNIRYNNFFPLANELLKIIERVNSGNVPDSQNILFYYGKKYMENQMNIVSKNMLSPTLFIFCTFYFNFYISKLIWVIIMIILLYLIYCGYLEKWWFCLYAIFNVHNKNAKFDYFEWFIYTCQMCGKYFFYGLQNIYRMNVDTIRYFRDKTYPFKNGN